MQKDEQGRDLYITHSRKEFNELVRRLWVPRMIEDGLSEHVRVWSREIFNEYISVFTPTLCIELHQQASELL